MYKRQEVNYGECLDYVRRSSNPSKLRITDVKFTKVDLPPWGCYLVRIDTNQGISGYGEMRDGASPTYLKYLKSRIMGENPCEVDHIFRKIKQFGGPARQAAGAVSYTHLDVYKRQLIDLPVSGDLPIPGDSPIS